MKTKFIKAMLDSCESPEEIDEVFKIAECESFDDRCALLEEEGCKYFDVPKDSRSRYELLKKMYTNDSSRLYRRMKKAKVLINEVL